MMQFNHNLTIFIFNGRSNLFSFTKCEGFEIRYLNKITKIFQNNIGKPTHSGS